jgi:predicted transcriptional regulator
MTEKRDRLQIIFDILKAVEDRRGKIKPTHLLYKSNLSHERLKKYIEELSEKSLIAEEATKHGKLFVLTDQGFKFLQDYKKMREFTESFGL